MRRGIVAIVVGIGSGCVPSRDNPFDPATAPAARLAIVSLEPCDNLDPTADWPVVATASRGACLALDATETKDPQGNKMTFTYFLADTAGNPREIIEEHLEEDFLIVPAALLRVQDLTTLTRFGVTATDSSGAKGTALTAVLLTNSPPFAPVPAPVLLPEGGFPWAPGLPMTIDLDGSAATDPDRDDPVFCWYLPETPPDACEFDGPIWTRPIPTQAARYLFYLQVQDDQLTSEKRTFVVRVGPPPLWSGGEGLERFDETLELWAKPAGTVPWLGSGAGGEEWLLLYDDGAKEIAVYGWPDRVPTGLAITLGPAQSAELVIATPLLGGGTRIWVAARTVGTSVELRAYDLDAAGVSLTAVGTRTVADRSVRVLSADLEGNVVLGGDSNLLEFVSADASEQWTVPLSPGTKIEGGGVIPETSIFSLTASGGIGDRIEVYEIRPPFEGEPPGPTMPRENQVLFGLGPLRQLEYFDSDRFWAAIPNAGLTLFERNTLTPIATVPDILEVDGNVRVDRGTGTCHLATASSLVSVDVKGRVRRSPIGLGSPVVHFVDDVGAVVRDSATADVLRISRTLDSSGLVSVIDLQPLNAERSISDGGTWAVSSAAAILRLSEDGTTLDYLTQLDLDTGETNLIDPVGVVDPDGRAGWFTERDATDTLYRVDFVAERDPGAPFRLPAVPIPSSLGFLPIGASNPTATTPFAWLWDPGPPARYATIDTLGTFVVHLTEEVDESDSRAAVSHRSGDLCVFSEVDASSTVRHRRISPLGNVSLPSAVVASSGALNLRSPFSFHEPDVCGVVAGTDDTHVLVWDDAPSLVASHVDADSLESVTAAADGIYWGAGPLTAQPGARILVRLVQGTSGAFVRETFPIDVPNTPLFLP